MVAPRTTSKYTCRKNAVGEMSQWSGGHCAAAVAAGDAAAAAAATAAAAAAAAADTCGRAGARARPIGRIAHRARAQRRRSGGVGCLEGSVGGRADARTACRRAETVQSVGRWAQT
jgi:hypothetical protein